MRHRVFWLVQWCYPGAGETPTATPGYLLWAAGHGWRNRQRGLFCRLLAAANACAVFRRWFHRAAPLLANTETSELPNALGL